MCKYHSTSSLTLNYFIAEFHMNSFLMNIFKFFLNFTEVYFEEYAITFFMPYIIDQ